MTAGTVAAPSAMAFQAGGSERLSIDSSGNITAVNAASGGQSVTLKVGASNDTGVNDGNIIINNGGTGNGSLQFDYESSAARAKIYVYRSTQDLIFDTAGSERLRIDSSGNTVIGQTTAGFQSKLTAGAGASDEAITILSGTSSGGSLYFADGTAADDTRYRGWVQYVHSSDYMKLGAGAGERIRIT